MSFRDDGSTYINEKGDTVFTSEFLRRKGRCCKSSCLHCPYGQTLRTIGVLILEQDENTKIVITNLVEDLVNTSSVTSSLLSEAFGSKPSYSFEDAKLLRLKEVDCGIVYIKDKRVQKVFLKQHFNDQGIDEIYIQSLLN
jgi:hypothetical protein